MEIKFPPDIDWHSWIERWDKMQDRYVLRRKERFDLMVRLIAYTQQTVSRILDIGCGTGSLMLTILERFPEAQVYGIDFDPTLLALAGKRLTKFGTRAHLVQTDLREKSWLELVPAPIDAAISATALHWFNPQQLAGFYSRLGRLLRPGGIFLNADHVRSSNSNVQKEWEQSREQMCTRQADPDADDWDGFWNAYGKTLKIDIEQFRSKFTGPWEGSEQGMSLEWHFEKLKASGFEALDCFWRLDCDAIYGGIRRQN
ncbi:MAG: class I SAM-dependent methyltransferase [Planctomycetota bacterium]